MELDAMTRAEIRRRIEHLETFDPNSHKIQAYMEELRRRG